MIKQNDLKGCFDRFDMQDYEENNKKRTCGLIFGVYNAVTNDESTDQVEYKFVIFENMVHL